MYLENQFIPQNRILSRILLKTTSVMVVIAYLFVTTLGFSGLTYKDFETTKCIEQALRKLAALTSNFLVKDCYAQFEPPDTAFFQSGSLKNFQADLFTGSAGFSIPITTPAIIPRVNLEKRSKKYVIIIEMPNNEKIPPAQDAPNPNPPIFMS